MDSWLDDLGKQARAQGLAKRSALFAVLVPVMLLLFAVVFGEGSVEEYALPIVVAAVGGFAFHLVFRWLEGRAG